MQCNLRIAELKETETFRLLAGSLCYRYLKFGSSEHWILGAANLSAKDRFPLCLGSL
jgi:hypothetical protein